MRIRVKVIPKSKFPSITEEYGGIVVRVRSSPERGRANEEAIKLLARYFGVKPSKVHLISGVTSRNKVFEIEEKKK